MDSYKIEWKGSAIKELKGLPREVVPRIVKEIGELSMNPYPHGVRNLVGQSTPIESDKALTESSIRLQRLHRSSRLFASDIEKMFTISDLLSRQIPAWRGNIDRTPNPEFEI